MKRLEHIGIAVKNLRESNILFTKLLGVEPYKIEEVESEGVRTAFFKVGDIKIELLEATRSDSSITTFIEKRGEGIHHLAFEVLDLVAKQNLLVAHGFSFISGDIKAGADDKRISFLHPKTTNRVLVELCEDIGKYSNKMPDEP